MLINLTCDEALRFAALAKAASSDADRAVLRGIHLEWRPDGKKLQLTAVTTDSYILAGRELTVRADDHTAHNGDTTGEVTVPAKLFADSVKTIAKTQTKRAGTQIVLSVTGEGMGVTGTSGDSPQFNLVPVDGTFPEWRRLFKGQGRKSTGTLPAFSPYLFNRLLSASSPTAATMRKAAPIQLTTANGEGQPYGFERHDVNTSTFMGLIMPAKVA